MRTLTNRGIRWIVREMRKRELSTYRIAKLQNITPRHARRIYKRYKDLQPYLIDTIHLQKPGRRPLPIGDYERHVVVNMYNKMPLCATKMEKFHKLLGIPRIPHNRIHRILTEEGLAKPMRKKIKRKKWVRWQRRHSNSLWHADYSEPVDGKQVIAYIDDASRKVVGHGKFDSATTDNALLVLDRAIRKYGIPKQVMTDHGAQFCADEKKVYRFRKELRKRGIEHIMSPVKKPQTNGKIERWFGTMDKLYRRFEFNLDKLVECYNDMPHLSLDTTPNIAYLNKMSKRTVEPIIIKR